jgi:glycosyltransferase involved in cell wall biosynthesis
MRAEVFARCSAMIVPLLFGSGVKVKTLEALACGLPVISTHFGAEGIISGPAEPAGIIVENDPRRFPRHMRALLDPQTNAGLRRQAREFFSAKFSADAGARRYDALFGLP